MKIQIKRSKLVRWIGWIFFYSCVVGICIYEVLSPSITVGYEKRGIFLSSPSVLGRGGDEVAEEEVVEGTEKAPVELNIDQWPEVLNEKNIQDIEARRHEIVAIFEAIVEADYDGKWEGLSITEQERSRRYRPAGKGETKSLAQLLRIVSQLIYFEENKKTFVGVNKAREKITLGAALKVVKKWAKQEEQEESVVLDLDSWPEELDKKRMTEGIRDDSYRDKLRQKIVTVFEAIVNADYDGKWEGLSANAQRLSIRYRPGKGETKSLAQLLRIVSQLIYIEEYHEFVSVMEARKKISLGVALKAVKKWAGQAQQEGIIVVLRLNSWPEELDKKRITEKINDVSYRDELRQNIVAIFEAIVEAGYGGKWEGLSANAQRLSIRYRPGKGGTKSLSQLLRIVSQLIYIEEYHEFVSVMEARKKIPEGVALDAVKEWAGQAGQKKSVLLDLDSWPEELDRKRITEEINDVSYRDRLRGDIVAIFEAIVEAGYGGKWEKLSANAQRLSIRYRPGKGGAKSLGQLLGIVSQLIYFEEYHEFVGIVETKKKVAPGVALKAVKRWARENLLSPYRDVTEVLLDRPGDLLELLAVFMGDETLRYEDLFQAVRKFSELNLSGSASGGEGGTGIRGEERLKRLLRVVFERKMRLEELKQEEWVIVAGVIIRANYGLFLKEYEKGLKVVQEVAEEKLGKEHPFTAFLLSSVEDHFAPRESISSPAHLTVELFPHQQIARRYLQKNDRFALLDDTRVGKTLSVISAIDPNWKSVILVPAGVLEVWKEHFAEFTQGLRLEVVRGPPDNRLRQLKQINQELEERRSRGEKNRGVVILMTIGTLRQQTEEMYQQINQGLDLAVVDEWQNGANFKEFGRKGNSQQGEGVQKIGQLHEGRRVRKWALSASPYYSNPKQLFSLLHWLKADQSEQAIYQDYDLFEGILDSGLSGYRILSAEMSKMSIRREKKDVYPYYEVGMADGKNSVPRKREVVIPYELSREQTIATVEMIHNFRGYVEHYNQNHPEQAIPEKSVHLFNQLKMLMWLMVAPEKVGVSGENPMLETLDSVVEQRVREGKKMILFVDNEFMADELQKRYEGYGVERIDGTVKGEVEYQGKKITQRQRARLSRHLRMSVRSEP